MTLLLVPDVECPRCHRKPALRISVLEQSEKMKQRDDLEVLSYRCRHCGEMYIITAKAYKGAA